MFNLALINTSTREYLYSHLYIMLLVTLPTGLDSMLHPPKIPRAENTVLTRFRYLVKASMLRRGIQVLHRRGLEKKIFWGDTATCFIIIMIVAQAWIH